MKTCYQCKETKEYESFYKRSTGSKDGYFNRCKICVDTYNKKWKKNNPEKHVANFQKWRVKNLDRMVYHSAQRRAKPMWGDKQYIQDLYSNSKEASKIFGILFEVDHIIPLNGKDVCGLHVPDNLQVLPRSLNREKSNKWN